nr:unnamed protein product [Trichobilharzia regenti]
MDSHLSSSIFLLFILSNHGLILALANSNRRIHSRHGLTQPNHNQLPHTLDEYALNKMQSDEEDLKLSKEMPILDTMIPSETETGVKSSSQVKLRAGVRKSNDFGTGVRNHNNKNNNNHKLNGQHSPKDDSNLLDSYWSDTNVGNIFDIGWDPSPPKGTDSQKDLVQPDETHLEGVPSFIQHPKPQYYTMKDHPATIECVAEPVSHAAIKCADQTIPYKGPGESGRLQITQLNSDNQPDPEGKRWVLRMKVKARDVEEWFDSYVCHCEAWNKVVELQRPKKVISKPTVVKEAYLDRKFQLEPVSTDLAVSKRLVLTCLPPKGDPDPEVFWLKDEKRVDSKSFPHIIINDYNHLIIENTTIADSGNYTCVASCLGIEYRYANARVNIFPYNSVMNRPANDDLTSWGDWGACHKFTTEGNNPQVICQQTRYRLCANRLASMVELKSPDVSSLLNNRCPLPQFQTRNCSVNQCTSFLNSPVPFGVHNADMKSVTTISTVPSTQLFRTREIAIYVGLFLSLAVLLAIVAIVALITRRKSLKFSTTRALHYSSCFHGKRSCRQEKVNKKPQDLLLSGDLTQTMITIMNPSVADTQKMGRMTQNYNNNTSNMNGKAVMPSVMKGSINGMQIQHQYTTTPVNNIPPLSTVGQSLVFSNGASLGTSTALLGNLPPPPAPPPPPPPTPPPPLPGTLPPIPVTSINLDGGGATPDLSGYSGFPSSLPSTQHFMNTLSCQVNGYLTSSPYMQTSIGHNNQAGSLGTEPAYVESDVALPRIGCGQNFTPSNLPPVGAGNMNGPNESSSGPSTANTGTAVTAVGSCNGGSSNGSMGLPINGCLTSRSPNFNVNYLNSETDACDEKCRPQSGLYHELSLDRISTSRSLSCEFKESFDLDTVVRATISCNGDQLALPESGVFLTIPQGALQLNSLVEVYLAICREDKHRPTLGDHQTLLSPVVQFGPVDLHFLKPILLSFPHCAALNQSSWLIRILALGPHSTRSSNNLNASNTNGYKSTYNGLSSNLDNFTWQEVGIIGYESNSSNLMCHLDFNMAHLMTDVAQRYCLVGETQKFLGANRFPFSHIHNKSSSHTEFHDSSNGVSGNGLQRMKITNSTNNSNNNNNNVMTDSSQDSGFLSDLQPATKMLKLAAFAGPLTPTIDYNIRVYVLADTKDALEHVLSVERRLEGKLLDNPKSLLFKDNGGGLCFYIEDISNGWRSRLQTKSQEIPFRHIWNGTQMSTLHCAFSLEHLDPRQATVSCKIIVYQENAQLQGQILEISSQKFENLNFSQLKYGQSRTMFSNSEDGNSEAHYSPISYRLPVVVSQRLCKMLDGRDSDWQKLAKHIGMEK